MEKQEYEAIIDAFPQHIPLPRIDRPFRHTRLMSGGLTLAEVKEEIDLPDRLIFGDLERGSFHTTANGWSVKYTGRDCTLELAVDGDQFTASPTFLGVWGMSCGPANRPEAFGQFINLGADQWDGVLQRHIEEKYTIRVVETDAGQGHYLHLPDGWLKTICVPVSPDRLGDLLDWHMALADDEQLGAAHTGRIDALFNAVNYIEGRCPEGYDNAESLMVRSFSTSGMPLRGPVVREVANDGTAAWTLRRTAYLYRLSAFLRDVPRLVELLAQAQFIQSAPDLCAVIAPAEPTLVASQMAYWSLQRECRQTWVFPEADVDQVVALSTTSLAQSRSLVEMAEAAGRAHEAYFSQREEQ